MKIKNRSELKSKQQIFQHRKHQIYVVLRSNGTYIVWVKGGGQRMGCTFRLEEEGEWSFHVEENSFLESLLKPSNSKFTCFFRNRTKKPRMPRNARFSSIFQHFSLICDFLECIFKPDLSKDYLLFGQSTSQITPIS